MIWRTLPRGGYASGDYAVHPYESKHGAKLQWILTFCYKRVNGPGELGRWPDLKSVRQGALDHYNARTPMNDHTMVRMDET